MTVYSGAAVPLDEDCSGGHRYRYKGRRQFCLLGLFWISNATGYVATYHQYWWCLRDI